MVFFIYQLGSLASVWAISNLIKKDVPQRIKNRIIILLLVTSWIGVLGYFFILKNRIEKWWFARNTWSPINGHKFHVIYYCN